MKRKPLENPKFAGCGYCGSTPLSILDDSKTFYPGSVHMLKLKIDGKSTMIVAEDGIKLSEIEEKYREQLKNCKFAELFHMTALHDETWELNTDDRKCYLVDQGQGYA